MLREAQVFSLEQQFNSFLKNIIPEETISKILRSMYLGQNVILKQNSMPDIVYTHVSHSIIKRIFEKKRKIKTKRFVIINEEAQNSFDVTEEGKEKNKGHVLLQVVCEGRKYGISLINVT